MHVGIANPRWREKRYRHSRRMRNPQCYVSGKGPMISYYSCLTLIWYDKIYAIHNLFVTNEHINGKDVLSDRFSVFLTSGLGVMLQISTSPSATIMWTGQLASHIPKIILIYTIWYLSSSILLTLNSFWHSNRNFVKLFQKVNVSKIRKSLFRERY